MNIRHIAFSATLVLLSVEVPPSVCESAAPTARSAATGVAPQAPSPATAPRIPPLCGSERWAVKTLSDDDAPKLVLDRVERTTISALNRLPRHCQGGPDKRSWPEEFTVYEVVGIVTHVRAEQDRDVHIVLSDPDDPQSTVIVEIADPECSGAADSPHVLTLQAARAAFTSLLRSGKTADPQPLLGRRVRIRGVGFYDFDHGQTGRSANCIELHPVIAIDAVSQQSP